jgi:hypothetical protein
MATRRSAKVGVSFSVQCVKRRVKAFLTKEAVQSSCGVRTRAQVRASTHVLHALRCSTCASIYLAAVLEYVVGEIVEVAGNVARDSQRTRRAALRIVPRDIYKVLQNDRELGRLFSSRRSVAAIRRALPILTCRSM